MRILSRSVFKEITVGALLGGVLFTFVLFLRNASQLFAIWFVVPLRPGLSVTCFRSPFPKL